MTEDVEDYKVKYINPWYRCFTENAKDQKSYCKVGFAERSDKTDYHCLYFTKRYDGVLHCENIDAHLQLNKKDKEN